MVDWGGLENRCPGNWTVGSNPTFSAPLLQAGPPDGGPVSVFGISTNELAHEENTLKTEKYAPVAHTCSTGAGSSKGSRANEKSE